MFSYKIIGSFIVLLKDNKEVCKFINSKQNRRNIDNACKTGVLSMR